MEVEHAGFTSPANTAFLCAKILNLVQFNITMGKIFTLIYMAGHYTRPNKLCAAMKRQ